MLTQDTPEHECPPSQGCLTEGDADGTPEADGLDPGDDAGT